MLPSDVLGVTIYNAHTEAFEFKPGPIFTNFLLADEINRTTPKTQSALLEAMNEQPGDDRRPLASAAAAVHGDRDAESGGASRHLSAAGIAARPLPDAAAHRLSGRRERARDPAQFAEAGCARPCSAVLSAEEVLQLQDMVQRVTVDESLVDYMLAIVEKTRTHESLALGVSPRGAQALYRATQALALVEGRDYVIPDDVKRLAVPIFAHRVVINARAALAQRQRRPGRAHHRRNPEPGRRSVCRPSPNHENCHYRSAHGGQDLVCSRS